MSVEMWTAYIATVFIMLLSPGPSHLLMASNSFQDGFSKALATAAGDLTANTGQILLASIGVSALMLVAKDFFITVKWAGVVYLVFIGVRIIRRKSAIETKTREPRRSVASLFWQGFATSAVNPKAVVFFAALFPQFIDSSEPVIHQFAILGISYLVIDGSFLIFYGHFAEWAANRFERQLGKHLNLISGSLLIGSAILLGLKDIGSQL